MWPRERQALYEVNAVISEAQADASGHLQESEEFDNLVAESELSEPKPIDDGEVQWGGHEAERHSNFNLKSHNRNSMIYLCS